MRFCKFERSETRKIKVERDFEHPAATEHACQMNSNALFQKLRLCIFVKTQPNIIYKKFEAFQASVRRAEQRTVLNNHIRAWKACFGHGALT